MTSLFSFNGLKCIFWRPHFWSTVDSAKMEPPSSSDDETPPNNLKKKNLSDMQRHEALCMLLAKSKEGKIQHGGVRDVSQTMGVSRQVLKRIWKGAHQTRAQGRVAAADWFSQKKKIVEKRSSTTPKSC